METSNEGDRQRRTPRGGKRQQRAAAWRAKGEAPRNNDRKSTRSSQMQGSVAIKFYNEMLRDNPDLRRKCCKRTTLDETIHEWKEREGLEGRSTEGASPSTIISKLKASKLIHQWSDVKKYISWTADVGEDSSPKNIALSFYDAKLRDDTDLRRSWCSERSFLNEIFNQWKQERSSAGKPLQVYIAPSTVISQLKEADLIHDINSTIIQWTADVDEMVLSFYDAKLRNNPRLRRSCTNRRILNDTINKWKVEQHLEGRTIKKITPAMIVTNLTKQGLIIPSESSGFREEIIWAEGIDGITPLSAQERTEMNDLHFDQRQVRANRTALSFYNEKLRDNRTLRRACAYRNILHDTIDEWKGGATNAGDPPRDVPPAAIIYGLIRKWELIDHVNGEQGIVAWKEDVHCYNDGIITWKDKYPYKDGKREWLSEDEFKSRQDQAKNERVSIVALSFYNIKYGETQR